MFLHIDSKQVAPAWMFTATVAANCRWKLVPVQLTLPCLLPQHTRRASGVATAWKITSPPQDLLKSSVKQGIFLTKDQLVSLQVLLGFKLPAKGSGSGTRGALLKIDYARALVAALFPETGEAAKEAHETMVSKIMGYKPAKAMEPEGKCTEELAAALGELEKGELSDFKHVSAMVQEKQRQLKQEPRTHPKAPSDFADAYERRTFTPVALKPLLPLGGEGGVYCNRNPEVKRYQASYPGLTLSSFNSFMQSGT